jgi:predicted ATPase
MLEYLHIKNFKALADVGFPLASLTVFSGLNGMGKSSVIQVLLLLRQSYDRHTLSQQGLSLGGDYTELGLGKDVFHADSQDDTISFVFKYQDRPVADQLAFTYQADTDLLPINTCVLSGNLSELSLFHDGFSYLSAERLGPRHHHRLSSHHVKNLNTLGAQGEYTVHYIAVHGVKPLSIPSLRHKNAINTRLLENLEAWMAELSPGLKIRATVHTEFNTAVLEYAFIQGNDRTDFFKPQNVGFGLSYILPVVTQVLSARPGDLLIIENPESHLHPAGQSLLGRLCALAAAGGVQLIIESHSDHFLNGIRVAVKQDVILSDQVSLFFLQRSMQSNRHVSEVLSPEIDQAGRVDDWPTNFFDEWDKQLEQLL